ncbi:hypothetical protein Dsin_021331 [Dipteronia sinensis]|uniref:RNase H type-1 domain-containing protein n=1 Tax=Dipteronia sinensis TaxID=43782 RepID=A0AAE0A0Y9_9ROSI|nr:hypothetical protein Dsin_021331 [Dipteronia sinensis]
MLFLPSPTCAIGRFQGLHCAEVLRGLAVCFLKEALEAVCMILWGIWQDRNEVVHKRKSRLAVSLVEGVLNLLKGFQDARSALQAAHVAAKAPTSSRAGTLKLNTDASVKLGVPLCGVGTVIRDDKGWIEPTVSKPLVGNFSPETGELIALRDGLLLATSLKLKISCGARFV